jgi:hypothetical protein
MSSRSLPEADSGLAAGVNDTFRQASIAVGIAALGALIPAGAALGHGDPVSFVNGLHHALLAGAGLAAVGAVEPGGFSAARGVTRLGLTSWFPSRRTPSPISPRAPRPVAAHCGGGPFRVRARARRQGPRVQPPAAGADIHTNRSLFSV